MLIPIERLIRRSADTPPAIQQEAVNPECIEQVRPVEVKGIDERCVEILVDGTWIQALGTMQEVLQAVNTLVAGDEDGGG